MLIVLCGRCALSEVQCFFFFQAEDGIRDLVRSRGLGDVYKRQVISFSMAGMSPSMISSIGAKAGLGELQVRDLAIGAYGQLIVGTFGQGAYEIDLCLLYTSDAADERSSVDLGGRRIIKKKQNHEYTRR